MSGQDTGDSAMRIPAPADRIVIVDDDPSMRIA